MKKMMQKLDDFFSIILFCLQVSLNSTTKSFRKYFVINIMLAVFSVILPFIQIYLASRIIGLLSGNLTGLLKSENISVFLYLCIGSLITAVSIKIADDSKHYVDAMYNDAINNHIKVMMMEKASNLDVCFFDSPAFYNEMRDATNNIPLIAQNSFQMFDLIKFFIQFTIAIICLSSCSLLFAFLLAISIIPNVILQKKQFHALYAWQRGILGDERKLYYLSEIMFSRTYVKDTKLFNLFPYIGEKYKNVWNMIFAVKKKISFRYTTLVAASSFLPEACMVMFLLRLGIGVISNTYTLGDYSYYTGIASQVLMCMYLVVQNFSHLMDGKSRIENYRRFMNWENKIKDDGDVEFHANTVVMEFRNVSFRYATDQQYILRNISFTICSPNKTAIVGENGSGKSTIVKLMTRLYDPNEGDILLNGINLKRYTLKSVRKCFSMMFQDYSTYAFNVRESVALSNYDKLSDDNFVYKALAKGDAETFLSKFASGLDTYLTKQYDESGVELSGGEWQKICASRTFFRDAPILVMDEPSASLDAISEDRLFHRLEMEYVNKCAVLISHRLANIINVDQILVLERGEITERGTHCELMKKNGKYAHLFNLQAKKYETKTV